MKGWMKEIGWLLAILVGSAVFALGFDLFLTNNGMNSGGVSGLAMVFVHLTGLGSVGTVTALMNLPLFILGGLKIGRRFFFGSLIGMVGSSAMIDLFALIPMEPVEPLLGAVYGGLLCGLGLGIVFAAGATTGGSDIVVRLLQRRMRDVPIGTINMVFDFSVAVLTGLAFQDASKALYTGVTTYLTGKVIDTVVYRFDDSKVAIIISPRYEQIAHAVNEKLDRGVTFLYGQGCYSGRETKVVLTALKRHQLAQLKDIVSSIDKDAFIIVQDSHQVLGDGFARNASDSL